MPGDGHGLTGRDRPPEEVTVRVGRDDAVRVARPEGEAGDGDLVPDGEGRERFPGWQLPQEDGTGLSGLPAPGGEKHSVAGYGDPSDLARKPFEEQVAWRHRAVPRFDA